MTLDLTEFGLPEVPTAPTEPPAQWAELGLSVHGLVKAHRVVIAAESLFFGLGLSDNDVLKLRPLVLGIESLVYGWDSGAEDSDDHAENVARRQLEQFVESLGCLNNRTSQEIEGLSRLFELERRCEEAPGAIEPWLELTSTRFSDIRLCLRVVMHLCRVEGAESLISALSPVLALTEVIDDLESVSDDAAKGSFNSFNHLCEGRGARAARHMLDDWAQTKAAEFRHGYARSSASHRRMLLAICTRPRSQFSSRLSTSLATAPFGSQLLLRAIEKNIAQAPSKYWGRPEFQTVWGIV